MTRPINRNLPFNFGPLLGPLAEPSGNPPPPDDPFGEWDDPVQPQTPKDRLPIEFHGPIKGSPIQFPWRNEDISVQDPKDRVPIERIQCSPDDFVVIVSGPYQDDGWYESNGNAQRPPFSSGMTFLAHWENRKHYLMPMLSLNPDTRGGFSFNGASDFGRLESIEFRANGKTHIIKVNEGPVTIVGNGVPQGSGSRLHYKHYIVIFEIIYDSLTGCTYVYIAIRHDLLI